MGRFGLRWAAVVAVLAAGFTVSGPAVVAGAETATVQPLGVSAVQPVVAATVRCGDNITTYVSRPPGQQLLQRLTYINCTGRTLHRKADIAWAGDGKCKRIPPWGTVVLAKDVLMRGLIHIRGSKRC